MVVRFPSDPFGGERGDESGDERGVEQKGERRGESSAARGEAPGVGRDDAGEHLAPVTPLRRSGSRAETGQHPSLAGRTAERQPEGVAEIVELPGATPWNNTWADDAPRTAERAGSPRSRDADSDEEDDEADRQSKKVSAVTIRQLARRGMSRWELEQVLRKRELEPEIFAPELDRLEALGVIDDASLAVSLAFTQHSRKGLGRTAIEQDLKRRHIDPELIEIALADIADEDELDRATELAVKRIGQLSSYDDETVRRRLHGFLARKGYNSGIVRQAMDAAFASRKRGGVRFQ